MNIKTVEEMAVLSWLDALVETHEKMKELRREIICDNSYQTCFMDDDIHLYNCIENVASAISEKLKISAWSEKYDCLSFEYSGVKFFELKERNPAND